MIMIDSSQKTKLSLECKVISLPSSTERRQQVQKNLDANIGLSWSFFDALSEPPEMMKLKVDLEAQRMKYGRELTKAEIGCYCSHVATMEWFLQNSDKDWLLVMEDDVWLDPVFDLGKAAALAEACHIHYLRLFSKTLKKFDVIAETWGFRHLVRFKSEPFGTQIYLIDKTGIKQFLSSLDCIELPIDDELGRFWRHSLFPCAIFPYPAVERSVPSTIEDGRADKNSTRKLWGGKTVIFRVIEKINKIVANRRASKLIEFQSRPY